MLLGWSVKGRFSMKEVRNDSLVLSYKGGAKCGGYCSRIVYNCWAGLNIL